VAHFRAGRLDAAARLAEQLAPLAALLFAEPNPAPVKALLAEIGLIRAQARPPILPVSDTLRARLTQALATLDEMGMAARI